MTGTAFDHISAWRRYSLLAGVAGLLLCVAGYIFNRDQFLRSYLFADMFWTGMALGCLGILLLHHTVGGKWGMVIRRLCEAGARTIPFMAIFLVPVLLAMPVLYVWTQPEAAHDAVIQGKRGVPERAVLPRPYGFLFRRLDFVCVPAEQMVGSAGSHR